MGRIGFAMAAIGSLVFLGWFGYQENENPGFGFAMAIIALPLLTALFGFSKSTVVTIASDGKGAAWAGLIIAAVGILYMLVFKNSWVLVAICCCKSLPASPRRCRRRRLIWDHPRPTINRLA